MEPVLRVTSASATPGTVRRGHGLHVQISTDLRRQAAPLSALRITLVGPALAGQRAAIRVLAPTLLPFRLTHVRGAHTLSARSSTTTDLDFTLGAKQLSHAALFSLVDTAVEAGDPVFLIELLCECDGTGTMPLAQIPTRASLIRASLSAGGDASIVAPGGVPASLARQADRQRRGSVLRSLYIWLRWWVWALAYTALCSALCVAPAPTLAWLPARSSGGLLLKGQADLAPGGLSPLARVLPPVPASPHAAFVLGGLAQRVEAAMAAAAASDNGTAAVPALPEAVPPLLKRAAGLVGRAALSLDELRAVEARLHEVEHQRGVIARVGGAFTFINLVWLLSIVGIAVSVGPSLVHALTPLREQLLRLARWLFRRVIEPLCVRLHVYGVFEAAAWLFTAALLLDAFAVFHPEAAVFVAATSAALALGPCFGYSSALWAAKLKGGDREALCSLVSAWACATLTPLALAHASPLLAYLATFAAYSALGFSVGCRGLCWVVGFHSKRAVERVCATSALLLASHLAVREARGRAALGPFDSPLSVVGALTLYLALLIVSSLYYERGRRAEKRTRYALLNLATMAALLLGAAGGWVCGVPGLANTATTFTVLWLVEKYAELHLEARWNGWFLLLLLSLSAYKGALWMHDHPAFVASMFGSS